MNIPQELTIAELIRVCDGIDGRVKLQKIVYLLEAIGYGFPYRDFRIQHYGPFSPRLAAAMDFLANAGVVTERRADISPDSTRFDYSVEERWGDWLEENVTIEAPSVAHTLDDIGEILSNEKRKILEIAATMCFLNREEGLSGQELATELKVLKGHLTPFDSNREEATRLLKTLNLQVA